MRYPGIKSRQCHIIWSFLSRCWKTAYAFLNCCDLLFLHVIIWVDKYSRNWRWLILFGTWYILFLLAWRISSLYTRYAFVAATPSPQRSINHHHLLLLIQLSVLYCTWSWSATSTDPILKLYIWMTLRLWNVLYIVFF